LEFASLAKLKFLKVCPSVIPWLSPDSSACKEMAASFAWLTLQKRKVALPADLPAVSPEAHPMQLPSLLTKQRHKEALDPHKAKALSRKHLLVRIHACEV
jgi:hypothetical protein